MRASHNDADFVFGLLVEVLGERVYLQSQLLGAQQFGVVLPGVHAQNDGIEVFGDTLGVPSHLFWEQSGCLQVRFGRVENLVI